MKQGAAKIRKGQYQYRGYILNCVGYFDSMHPIWWEAINDKGEGELHAPTKKELMRHIDEDIDEMK